MQHTLVLMIYVSVGESRTCIRFSGLRVQKHNGRLKFLENLISTKSINNIRRHNAKYKQISNGLLDCQRKWKPDQQWLI